MRTLGYRTLTPTTNTQRLRVIAPRRFPFRFLKARISRRIDPAQRGWVARGKRQAYGGST